MALGGVPVSIVIYSEYGVYKMAKHLSLDGIITIQNELTNSSTLRKKNLMVPVQRFIALYGSDTAKKLNIKLIDPNQVTLNKSIFKK